MVRLPTLGRLRPLVVLGGDGGERGAQINSVCPLESEMATEWLWVVGRLAVHALWN